MRYVRRRDNPLVIRSFGDVEVGGLGEFDPAIYEEVVGELPKGWTPESFPESRMDNIRAVFQKAIQEKPDIANAKVQKELLKLADVVERAIGLGLYGAAIEAIKEPTLDPALEPYRTEMLNSITA